MRPIQVVILIVALVAAGAAGVIAMNLARKPQQVAANGTAATKLPLDEVLVASSDLTIGAAVTPDKIAWRTWPAESVTAGFITRKDRPDAVTQLEGTLVRAPILAGEPVRDAKLVRSDRGFLSAILPKGMRAVAVKVNAAATAGGFILPNDRIDVVLVRSVGTSGSSTYQSETLLTNIRVLAIDQMVEGQDDTKSVVVAQDTATLELTPEQAELVAQAQQVGTISLSLRSIEDTDDGVGETSSVKPEKPRSFNVVKYGIPQRVGATDPQ